MDSIAITGGTPLNGEIPISGAKNSAIKLMVASLLTDEPESESVADQVLGALADAITALASARKRISVQHLLRETALNLLILGRIASNRVEDRLRREEIESATDHLVTLLRHAAWDLPSPTRPATTPEH